MHGLAGRALLRTTLAAAVAACSTPDPTPLARGSASSGLLPMSIHAMPLVAVTVGENAEALIGRLHGKDVAPVASYVGRYEGGGAAATLYVSRLSDTTTADSLVTAMAHSIGAGNRTFAHHAAFAVDDVTVHVVLSQGQTHFFFARGTDVAWLAIDRAMARVGLADLLGLSPARMPAGLVLGGVDILPPPDSLYHRQSPTPTTPTSREPGGPR